MQGGDVGVGGDWYLQEAHLQGPGNAASSFKATNMGCQRLGMQGRSVGGRASVHVLRVASTHS